VGHDATEQQGIGAKDFLRFAGSSGSLASLGLASKHGGAGGGRNRGKEVTGGLEKAFVKRVFVGRRMSALFHLQNNTFQNA